MWRVAYGPLGSLQLFADIPVLFTFDRRADAAHKLPHQDRITVTILFPVLLTRHLVSHYIGGVATLRKKRQEAHKGAYK